MALGVRQAWVTFLVTLGKGLPSSVPQFPHLSNGNANSCLQDNFACRGMSRVPLIQHLELSPRLLINMSYLSD